MYNTDLIDQHFPLQQYRPNQKETIKRTLDAWNSGKKFVMLEAPTGSGKSAIGMTLCQFMTDSYYLAPQKFLQDQLDNDFGEFGKNIGNKPPMIILKGRNAYPCNYWQRQLQDPLQRAKFRADMTLKQKYIHKMNEKIGCDQGQCKLDGKSRINYCVDLESNAVHCPYYEQYIKARNSKICLMNFHNFFLHGSGTNFGERELLILDEGHNTEDMLMSFIEFKLSDRNFSKFGIKFPKFEYLQDYMKLFEEIKLNDLIDGEILSAKANQDIKEEEEWKGLKKKYEGLTHEDPNAWVCIWDEVKSGASRTVTIKPIFIDEFANALLFNKAKKVLIMSATIFGKRTMCEALGIDPNDCVDLYMKSTFPLENRPIFYNPSGSMSYNDKSTTLPKMIKDINKICEEHKTEKGIIHTHNFEIAEAIFHGCEKVVRDRFLYQRSGDNHNKQDMLEKHTQMENSILLAPAMHEGLDLKDDLGRFQIICKVPYPSTNDPQIAARMLIHETYYDWRTATKLVQSYGRIIRHDKDFGTTYVLDDNFKRFVKKNERLLPKWFTEAIHW